MKTKLPFTIIFIFFGLNIFAQTREVPFTLEDRDRIILIEEKLNSQQMQINDIKKEIGNLRGEIRGEIGNLRAEIKVEINGLITQYYWGFGILIAILLFLLGYIIWDRRTAIAPLRNCNEIT